MRKTPPSGQLRLASGFLVVILSPVLGFPLGYLLLLSYQFRAAEPILLVLLTAFSSFVLGAVWYAAYTLFGKSVQEGNWYAAPMAAFVSSVSSWSIWFLATNGWRSEIFFLLISDPVSVATILLVSGLAFFQRWFIEPWFVFAIGMPSEER